MRNIYILLTRSGTILSRLIGLTTAEDYTHVSIGLDEDRCRFYSFGRRNPHRPLPAGLVKEDLADGFFSLHPDMPCALYRLSVNDTTYAALRQQLDAMIARAEHYHYNLLGLIFCLLAIPHSRSNHYFCSQFVGTLLKESGCLSLPRHASLLHPCDFAALPDAELCYSGKMRGLCALAAAGAA